ncbi:MAG: AMP-binding protein [Candidatus Helarchaeota archaeon]|nr:AMP-binding protein [Candidatus Helarchaeota archaeon]
MSEENPCDFDLEKIANFDDESSWVRPGRPWLRNRDTMDVPKSLNFPKDLPGAFCLLKRSAIQFPNNLAFYFIPKNEKFTYYETDYFANKFANALVSKYGIKKGDGVAIMTGNNSEFIFSVYGVEQTGGILVPINPLLKKKEVTHIVSTAGNVKVFVVADNLYGLIKRIRKNLDVGEVIVISDKKDMAETTFGGLLDEFPPTPPKVKLNIEEDLAALLFTGGTTGLPKGVMLTHLNIISNTLQLLFTGSAGSYTSYEENLARLGTMRAITCNPLCHGMGFFILNSCIAGAISLLIDRFDPPRVLKWIEMYRLNSWSGIPAMFNFLINHPDFEKADLSSLDFSASGAAPLPPKTAEIWRKKTGLKVMNAYGLTEVTCMATCAQCWEDINPISISFPVIDTDAKIVDPPDYITELPPGEAGELLIRGPQVMKGYWQNPEATARTLVEDENGKIWLRTGDIAKVDENGFFYIVGRSKEQIKYKGYRVLPAEVESGLYEHPAVLECGVIGLPDEVSGETIKAFIKLKPEYKDKITEQEIIDWAKETMAGYKWPRLVEFVGSIPRTPVGKVMRRTLLEKELKKRATQ